MGAAAQKRTVGSYLLDVKLGGAGNSEVWAVHSGGGEHTEHTFAVKLFKDQDLDAAGTNPTAQFPDEARAAQTLDHPSLVKTYEFANSEHGHYLVMELVRGPSLAVLLPRLAALKHPALSAATVAHLGVKLAEALDYAANHAQLDGFRIRLVHRHLSPHNVLIDAEGRVRLGDLGVAPSDVCPDPTGSGRTIRGKAGYLSPEHFTGAPVDERSDLFCLGIILYECATLRPLFATSDVRSSIDAVLQFKPKLLSEQILGFPRALAVVIQRMLEKDPAARFQTAQEAKDAMAAAAEPLLGFPKAQAALSELVKLSFGEGAFTVQTAQGFGGDEEPTVRGGGRPKEVSLPDGMSLGVFNATKSGGSAAASGPWPAASSWAPLASEAIDGARKEIQRSAPPPPAPRSESFGDKAMEQVNQTLERPERRKRVLIVAGVLLGLFILRAVIVGRAGSADSKLREIYESGSYAIAAGYFVEHMGEFKYPVTAFELATDARIRGLANGTIAPPADLPTTPSSGVVAGSGASGASDGETEAAAAAELPSLEEKPAEALLPPKKTAADLTLPAEVPEPANLGKNAKKLFKSASSSYHQAADAMSSGDLDKAERLLQHCLEEMELPLCHLRLGALYTQRGSEAKSVRHYKRYLGFEPRDPQAGELQRRIEQAEGRR